MSVGNMSMSSLKHMGSALTKSYSTAGKTSDKEQAKASAAAVKEGNLDEVLEWT